MNIKWLLPILILGFIFLIPNAAMAYTINGSLDDWGVDPSTPGSEDWIPNPGVHYVEEDYVGPSGYVNPGWGGQTFDAEALYVDWDDTTLYLALASGWPSSDIGTYKGHSAGDIGIDFGANGTYEYGIEIGAHKTGYTRWSGGAIGDVYKNILWDSVKYAAYSVSNPANIAKTPAPTYAGSATGFSYIKAYDNPGTANDHWVAEMSIPRSVFGSDWDSSYNMKFHWTQTCGNDNINVTTPAIPEPMSMVLFGSGALAMLFGFKKKKLK